MPGESLPRSGGGRTSRAAGGLGFLKLRKSRVWFGRSRVLVLEFRV